MAEKVYRIRKLVWREHMEHRVADTSHGSIWLLRLDDDTWHIDAPMPIRGNLVRTHRDLEAAKRAAEAHYEARMREGLEECNSNE